MRNNKKLLQVLIFIITPIVLPGCLNHKFYQPDQILYETPDRYNLAYEDVFFQSKDGTKLHGWFIPARGEAVGTIIHFHGNFGNLTYYLRQIYWLPSKHFNVFTFDYRGYGRSEGTPSRAGIYEDSVAAIDYIISKRTDNFCNVFAFAQSLGGANAIAAIAKNDFPEIRAIAIEAAFFTYRAEAQDMMAASAREKIGDVPLLTLPIGPVAFLSVTNSYSAGEFIDQVSPIPVLLIHCLEDSVVSSRHSERLYKKAKEPKNLWIISACSHLEVFTEKKSEYGYRERLLRFFENFRRPMK